MKLAPLPKNYELLADRADEAFQKMGNEYGPCIKCERQCSDCCHAIFGLFAIEAAYIKTHFEQLDGEKRKSALLRCNEADRALKRLEVKMQLHEDDDPQTQALVMASERISCPLLDEGQNCIIYSHRPITCRVYGIPTMVQGHTRVCGKALFKKGESYPVFNLDGVYGDLYALSREMLENAEKGDPAKADLLVSVSRAISTPLDDLLYETFE